MSADGLDDKSTAATGDKLMSASNERQLQEQRKQRAAAFVTRMKHSSDVSHIVEDVESASNAGQSHGTVVDSLEQTAWVLVTIDHY